MFTTEQLAEMLEITGRAANAVTVTYGDEETSGRYSCEPMGVLDDSGRAEVQGSRPSVEIAVGAISVFGPNRGVGKRVTILVPEEFRAVLDHPAEKEWEVVRVLPGGELRDSSLTIRLLLTEAL